MNIDALELRTLLEDAFLGCALPSNIEDLKMGDIVEWDSMGNFNLLLTAEERYSIKFNLEEMAEIRSIIQLKNALQSKI